MNKQEFNICDNKELNNNDILNLSKALKVVSEFFDVNAVAIVKDGNPCAVALGKSVYDAYTKAFDCNPVNAFGGTFAFSQKVDYDSAKHLASISAKAIIAPDFDEKALELLRAKSSAKIVKLNITLEEYKQSYESIFGMTVRDKNLPELNTETFKVVTKTKPTVEQVEDAVFGWKVAKYTEEVSSIVVKDFKTISISQTNSEVINAVENALNEASDDLKDAVLVCDCPVSVEDCIYAAVQNRIGLIIQTGGIAEDAKFTELCNKYSIAMITTGTIH